MKIYAISPETFCETEADIVGALLDAGLDAYHLRKPLATRPEVECFLKGLSEKRRSRIVLHEHHSLVNEWGLMGYHFKDRVRMESDRQAIASEAHESKCMSRSLHCIEKIDADVCEWDYVFLSPIFPSISKQGYASSWSDLALVDALGKVESNTRICALGGIDLQTASKARDLGFGGVVLHGALWGDESPVSRFSEIEKALR
ncbi:thiamine phosphate synthase [Puniceicoccaceae bacterium K14]|nr:thiamine phosphate synthase [Puniceicoccaceae bacterium K14]